MLMTDPARIIFALRDIVAAYETSAADPESKGVIYTAYNAKCDRDAVEALVELAELREKYWALVKATSTPFD